MQAGIFSLFPARRGTGFQRVSRLATENDEAIIEQIVGQLSNVSFHPPQGFS
jgi:hypothetical protein